MGSTFHLNPSPTLKSTFVMGVYSFLYMNYNTYDSNSYIFNTEDLRLYLGYSRGGKSRDIKSDLLNLNNLTAYAKGETIPLAEVHIEKSLTYLRSDYFHSLSLFMKEITSSTGMTAASRYTSVCDISLCKVRDTSAVEVCIELCKVIERRGSTELAPAHIAIDTLVNRCPTLNSLLAQELSNGRKNSILRQSITHGLELLSTHTAVPTKYTDLVVSAPPMICIQGLTEVIEIRHKGRRVIEV